MNEIVYLILWEGGKLKVIEKRERERDTYTGQRQGQFGLSVCQSVRQGLFAIQIQIRHTISMTWTVHTYLT